MLIFFFLLWIIFNGAITKEILVFGVVIAFLMFFFVCRFMDYSLRKEKLLYIRSVYFAWYLTILLIEIVKANFAVCRFILDGKQNVQPAIVSFQTTLRSSFARVILANSITLTPGTITVSLKGDELIVHCLDQSFADGMDTSVFVKMLEKMERMGQ